jgi:hypothetical protein
MTKQTLLLLALCIPGLCAAQEPTDRMLGLVTQDQNGLFVVLVVAMPGEVRASVRQFSPEHAGDVKSFPYSRELFDELWLSAKNLGLSAYAATNVPDVRASENYVITIGMGTDPKRETYLVPKCTAPAAIASFVKRLTHELLPPGSPGLFAPCTESNGRNDG